MTTSAAEADAMLDRLLEGARERLGRPPTRKEMLRWARVYRAVARGLDARAGRKPKAKREAA